MCNCDRSRDCPTQDATNICYGSNCSTCRVRRRTRETVVSNITVAVTAITVTATVMEVRNFQVGDLVWKRHIDQIREFVPQENKDIPNILEITISDIDTEFITVPTCNSNRDTENSENNNESEQTKITENKTVENANDTIVTNRTERVRKAPERLIENI
ncbi:unnamed protein product [Mytilus edulis]|uniref:Uncharacterized protein n=1 Tax=Mytilus edulis TaxID=6550 RepID=A0A8S3UFR6_MYTED|nr:unnamed protein product [Mytilus edulis]